MHGVAHLGALQALEEAGLRPDLLAGTSAGAIAAGLYASGVDLSAAADIIAGLNLPQMLDFAGGLRSMVPGVILTRTGIIQGDHLEATLDRLTGSRALAEARPPLALEAVDIVSGELVVLTSLLPPGNPQPLPRTVFLTDARVSQAMRASMSVPGIFVPKQLHGRMLVDGGVRDMVPTRVLRALGAQVVVAVDLTSAQDHSQEVRNFPEVILRALGLLEREATRDRLVATAEVVIAPLLPPLTSLDKKALEEHIRLGREATYAQLPALRRLLG